MYKHVCVCECVCLCVRNMVYMHVCVCVCGEHVCVSMSLGGVNMHVCDCVNMCVSVCAWGCERV